MSRFHMVCTQNWTVALVNLYTLWHNINTYNTLHNIIKFIHEQSLGLNTFLLLQNLLYIGSFINHVRLERGSISSCLPTVLKWDVIYVIYLYICHIYVMSYIYTFDDRAIFKPKSGAWPCLVILSRRIIREKRVKKMLKKHHVINRRPLRIL